MLGHSAISETPISALPQLPVKQSGVLVQIITPEKTLFSAEAEMVTIPGTEGDFGVLAGHAPFISSLKPGAITVDTADGKQHSIEVTGGFAEVVPERVTVLVEVASQQMPDIR